MQSRVLKVAAIENDAVDQLILRRLLQAIPEWQVELTGYVDAGEALRNLPHNPPDLIFLDYQLASHTGLQFPQELRPS